MDEGIIETITVMSNGSEYMVQLNWVGDPTGADSSLSYVVYTEGFAPNA